MGFELECLCGNVRSCLPSSRHRSGAELVDTLSQEGWKKAKRLAQQMWVSSQQFWLGLSRDDSLKIMQLQLRGRACLKLYTLD